jgi:hypothetical protein
MSLSHTVAPALAQLASGSDTHASLNPIVTGGSALLIFLVLLFLTTRFNKDR